ncbi:MAG TPA: ECF transporter S component [Peptococcaceae bacterium]|nr:ECF transporter S component [Peptococcaceae bacterium]
MKTEIKKITLSGLFLALCMVLPFLTGQIPQIGSALAPMHIPVLLCGFVCGWPYGLAVGFIAPLLRFLLFGMPPIFPVGLAMAFELAAYGVISGILYKLLPKKTPYLYVSLIVAMLIGRVVWGILRFALVGFASTEFSFGMFLGGAFITAIPGIVCHILLIPVIVIAMQKAKLIVNG